MRQKKALGILGGMGPEASAYLYSLLISMANKEFGVVHNDEFPEIILHSIPVPDFISSDKEKEQACTMLITRVRQLNTLPISALAIACNTAHMLLPQLQKVSDVPFISMIDNVVSTVVQEKKKAIAILGTPSTIRSGLYQRPLMQQGITVLSPTKQQLNVLEQVIRHVIAGKTTTQDKKDLLTIANALVSQGAEGIILGCTELPLVFPKKYKKPVYSSLEILARSLLREYYK